MTEHEETPLHDKELVVTKHESHVPISDWMAMEYGLLPDTRPPVVVTRRQRLRWARHARIRKIRIAIGSWIAGEDLDPDHYD